MTGRRKVLTAACAIAMASSSSAAFAHDPDEPLSHPFGERFSVFARDGDGDADTLVLSVDSVLAGPECGAAPVGKSATTGRYPDGAWEGLRIFDVSDPADPRQV